MAIRNFIRTQFACAGFRNSNDVWRDPNWIHYRVHVYQQLTLNSLLRQTFTDFDILLECHPDAEPLMQPYATELEAKGVRIVYDCGVEYIRSLSAEYDRLAMLRIDSDDMYAYNAIELMVEQLEIRDAVQCYPGYWWDIEGGGVRRWKDRSPPFYGIAAPREQITNFYDFIGDRLKRRRGRTGHNRFRNEFNPAILSDGLFLVVHHDRNITAGRSYGAVRLVPAAILPRFGISAEMYSDRRLDIPEKHNETNLHSDAQSPSRT